MRFRLLFEPNQVGPGVPKLSYLEHLTTGEQENLLTPTHTKGANPVTQEARITTP